MARRRTQYGGKISFGNIFKKIKKTGKNIGKKVLTRKNFNNAIEIAKAGKSLADKGVFGNRAKKLSNPNYYLNKIDKGLSYLQRGKGQFRGKRYSRGKRRQKTGQSGGILPLLKLLGI